MPATENPPSPWTAIDGFTKTIVTLASALLGLTVTFASQLVGQTDNMTRGALYIAWGLCAFCVISGVLSHGFVVAYLKEDKRDKLAVLFANISFWALVLAVIGFIYFGASTMEHTANFDVTEIVETATIAMPKISGDKSSNWNLKSIDLDKSQKAYEVVMEKVNSSETFELTLDVSGKIVSAKKP